MFSTAFVCLFIFSFRARSAELIVFTLALLLYYFFTFMLSVKRSILAGCELPLTVEACSNYMSCRQKVTGTE